MRGTFLEVESVDKTHKVDYSIVGINYCSAEYLKGVEQAADSLRKASFRYGNADGSSLPIKVFSPERGYILQNTNLADYGNIEVSSESDLILKLMKLDLSKLGTPIFTGGDHAVTYYTVDRIQKERNSKPIIVFQFDAHSDYIDEFADYPHGSVMCETSRIDGVEKIIHFGLRGNLNCGPALLESKRRGNIIIPYKDIKMMFQKVLGELKDKDIYITFDTDFLNPMVAPATDNPEPGGPTYEDTIYYLQGIIESCNNVVGMDVVEYNPTQEGSSVTASTLVNIIMESFGFLTTKNLNKKN